ncbi:MAG: hypothetical protein WCK75_09895 [Elusimicrobiota bacterium]
MPDNVYENHLKGEYGIENGEEALIVTPESCYYLSTETRWLIDNLPAAGNKGDYLSSLTSLGVEQAGGIFDRLININVLRIKTTEKLIRKLIGHVLKPKIRLISAKWQENVFRPVQTKLSQVASENILPLILCLAAIGLAFGLFIPLKFHGGLVQLSEGRSQALLIFGLVLLGSLIHELGHSFTAAMSGIGFRPIGISIYLFYPVFYTNVAGIEKVSFWRKIAIDCGGFVFQTAFLWILMATWFITRNISLLESVRWMALIMAFNLNPLLRTDAYWLYQDVRATVGNKRLMDFLHYVYSAAFIIFTCYIFICIWHEFNSIIASALIIWAHPHRLPHDGYKIIIGCYLVLMACIGGIARMKEGHKELF